MDSRIDLIFAVLIALAGSVVVLIAWNIPDGVYRDAIGPRAFPLGTGILMLAGGAFVAARRAALMFADLGWQASAEGAEDEPGHPASLARAMAILAISIAYAATFTPLGYLIATPPFIAATLWVMRERSVPQVAAISILWTVVTYVVFAQLLAVRLPVGPLRAWFRELGLVTL